MNKKASNIAAILALALSTAQAAQQDYYVYQDPSKSVYVAAINYVPLSLEDAVKMVGASGYELYTSFTCTNWSLYFNQGATPIPAGSVSPYSGAPNSIGYSVPLHLWGCSAEGRPLSDRYTYYRPITHVVCLPGYSVSTRTSTSSNYSECVPDTTESQNVSASNEQGPPLNCEPCLQTWLQDQAPNSAPTTSLRGKPVNAANGNEHLTQEDYVGAGSSLLSFVRYYNSGYGFDAVSMGKNWSHNFSYRAMVGDTSGSAITLIRPDGGSLSFTKNTATNAYTGPSYTKGVLAGTFSGSTLTSFTFTRADGTVEQYSSKGQLNSISFAQGGTISISNSSQGITAVSDGRGHSLTFTYVGVAGLWRIQQVTAPGNQSYVFGYDTLGHLVSVKYPDGGTRTYQYPPAIVDGAANPLADKLVGIVDENNSNYATITYDGLGRATSTQFGAGVELTTFAYGGTSTTVTHSLGVQEVMSFASLVGRPQTQSITTRCDNGCPADGQGTDQFVYDNNGNATAITNKFGVKTCIAYDTARNLPTKVVDSLPADASCAGALSSPPATSRVKTYQWHATFAVPLTVTGPLSKVTATYDSAGRKLTETEYETTDTSGASGVRASTTGTPRTTTWTYNSQGLVLTIKAPRTDINATTTYAYDSNQNLTSVTNEAGLVTTFGNYDANGRPQLITAPNGLQTTMAYDVRGRTTSITTAGATTTYGYDAVGQLTSSVLPSGVTVTFTYDDAHRLIATADSFGNRVDRTLDSEGNVLQETVTGNGSVLAMSRQTAYDQLSRATSLIQAQ